MNKYTKSLSVAAILSVMSISLVSAQSTTTMPNGHTDMGTSTMMKKHDANKKMEKSIKKEMKAKKSHKSMKKMHTASTTPAHN